MTGRKVERGLGRFGNGRTPQQNDKGPGPRETGGGGLEKCHQRKRRKYGVEYTVEEPPRQGLVV